MPLWQDCRLLTSNVVVAVMLWTHTASVTGTELSEEEAGPQGLRLAPGWVSWAGICLGIPVVEAATQCSTGFHQQDFETPFLFILEKGRNVDKIAEMDWLGDKLFNTGWHFSGWGMK